MVNMGFPSFSFIRFADRGRGEEDGGGRWTKINRCWRPVGSGTSGRSPSQRQSRGQARIVLNPTREWAKFEDRRLSSPQRASSSRPSLGGQENRGQTSVGMGYKHLYCRSINRADRSCRAEGNGTVRVGKCRGRRIHVSNQHALAPKSERVKKE